MNISTKRNVNIYCFLTTFLYKIISSELVQANSLKILEASNMILQVQCLKCVQCSSLYEVDCTDGYIEPKNCSNNESFCTKYEGTLKKVKFVIRGCSDEEETSDCGLRTIQTGMTVNVCFETCRVDGCNSALAITMGGKDLIFPYVMSLFVLWSIYKQLFLENT